MQVHITLRMFLHWLQDNRITGRSMALTYSEIFKPMMISLRNLHAIPSKWKYKWSGAEGTLALSSKPLSSTQSAWKFN